MFRLIAIDFSQKSPHFSLLSPTSPCELSEREVTSPSNLKVVRAPEIRRVGGILIYPLFVRSSGYRYMVCPAISSYSFGATALIFCRMFIHIMEVCMSTGF